MLSDNLSLYQDETPSCEQCGTVREPPVWDHRHAPENQWSWSGCKYSPESKASVASLNSADYPSCLGIGPSGAVAPAASAQPWMEKSPSTPLPIKNRKWYQRIESPDVHVRTVERPNSEALEFHFFIALSKKEVASRTSFQPKIISNWDVEVNYSDEELHHTTASFKVSRKPVRSYVLFLFIWKITSGFNA